MQWMHVTVNFNNKLPTNTPTSCRLTNQEPLYENTIIITIPVDGSCPSMEGGEMQTQVVAGILQEGSIIQEGRLGEGLEVDGRPLTHSLLTMDPVPGFLAFS